MQKLLFLSDPHITAPGETIIGLDPAARMQAVLDAALAAHPDASALILLGDMTHNGRPAEYAELRRILAPVMMPVIPMIGNHDRRDAFLDAFPDAPQTNSGHIQRYIDMGDHRIITLDSLDGPPYPEGHHAGRLCADRIAFLEEALTTRGDRHAIVCIHHPPFDTGVRGMDRIKLQDGTALMARLAAHGNLHLICGHLHLTVSGQTAGVPWTILKSPCHQGIVDLENPNAHLSSDEAGSYGLGLLTKGGFILHSCDVGTGARLYGGYGTDEPH